MNMDADDISGLEDAVLDIVATQGAQRCINRRRRGTSAIVGSPPEWEGDAEQMFLQQAQTMGVDVLRANYVELLKRSQSLLDFVRANVGPSAEWPIALHCENDETENLFTSHMDDLNNAVGCLVEL